LTIQTQRAPSGLWLLTLFTFAGFIETVFYGQMNAFTPLYLPKLGVPLADVAVLTGAIVAISNAIGIPFLPFWGALADRYARQPIIVRSSVAHLIAGLIMLIARDVWVFVIGRSIMSLALGNSGLMMTTLSERAPGTAVGLVLGAGGLATLILSPIVGALADRFRHRRTQPAAGRGRLRLRPRAAVRDHAGLRLRVKVF
jgi:MFS family permease